MKLKAYLTEKNVKIADFARLVGHSESAVKKWLREERVPRPRTLNVISGVTGGEVQPADFIMSEAA
jgi:DNA-binding transcriptional regulator YiaG